MIKNKDVKIIRDEANFNTNDMHLTDTQAKWIKTMTTEERLKRLPEIKIKLIGDKIETIKKNIPKKNLGGQAAVVLQQIEDIVKA